MTDNEIRVSIAEAMPSNLIHFLNGEPFLHIGGDRFVPFDPVSNLDAVHLAEKTLYPSDQYGESSQWDEYISNLEAVSRAERTHGFHSTARQRAEAFLRTIGKWKEEQ